MPPVPGHQQTLGIASQGQGPVNSGASVAYLRLWHSVKNWHHNRHNTKRRARRVPFPRTSFSGRSGGKDNGATFNRYSTLQIKCKHVFMLMDLQNIIVHQPGAKLPDLFNSPQ